MTELDDIDALAAEYVLGTLTHAERQAAETRRRSDRAFDAAVSRWEGRLAPLADVVAPVAPPADLFDKIRNRIANSNILAFSPRETALARKAGRWRAATLGMSAMAACLAAVVGWQAYDRGRMPTQYVAVLQADKALPAFLLTVDTKSNMFVVSAMQKPVEPEKSYQLWLVHDGMPEPKSLGVFDDSEMDVRPMAKDAKMHDMMMDGTYAVSVEPKGGSPTGIPTGPVVFSGKLVKASP